MRKSFLLLAMITGFSLALNAQFSDKGYKKIRPGMTAADFKELGNVTVKEDGSASVKYDGISLSLKFGEYDYSTGNYEDGGLFLYTIETKSKNAKLQGVTEDLIGKKYDDVKKILGSQLKDPWEGMYGDDEPDFPADYLFYAKGMKVDPNFSCVLSFNEKGILELISVYPNP